jgi:dihydroneopterin triphosphate diphosphatase
VCGVKTGLANPARIAANFIQESPLKAYKIPRSVLVVIYTPALDVLLIERTDSQGQASGFWQSVTGSLDFEDESFTDCAIREVAEETGLEAQPSNPQGHLLTDWLSENSYDIYPSYTERVFGLLIPAPRRVQLAPAEHVNQLWLPWQEAALKVRSASNEWAIRKLGESGLLSQIGRSPL